MRRGSVVTLFTEEAGGLLAAVTWIGFGALALGLAIPHITWQIVLYAALSLTLVRMVPVAIALAGRGITSADGGVHRLVRPEGACLARVRTAGARARRSGRQMLLTTVVVTVALSVVLHGLTSVPLVGVYHRWYEAHAAANPEAEEAAPATMPRQRRQPGGAGPERPSRGQAD